MAYVPDDLRDTSTPDTDKDYFKVVATDLNLLTTYPFQFRWQYEDRTYSEWSATLTVTTKGESVDIPSQPVVDAGYGRLIITWDGNNSVGTPMTDIDRINVYINGTYYGSIFTKGFIGRLSVSLPSGTYSVTFKAVSKLGKESAASAATIVSFSNGVEEAYTDLQNKLSAGGGVIANAQKQIVSIDTGSGLIVYASSGTATTGNRVILNAEGLAGFQSDGKSSFAILTNTKYYDPTTQIMYSTNAAGRETIDAGTGFFNGMIYAQGGRLVKNLTIATNMKLGAMISGHGIPGITGDVDGIVINSNNYWLVGTKFKIGNSNYSLEFDTSTLTLNGIFKTKNYGITTNNQGGIQIFDNTGGDGILFSQANGSTSYTNGSITSVPGGLTISGPNNEETIVFTKASPYNISFQVPNGTVQAYVSSAGLNVYTRAQNANPTADNIMVFRNISTKTTAGYPTSLFELDGDIILVREP